MPAQKTPQDEATPLAQSLAQHESSIPVLLVEKHQAAARLEQAFRRQKNVLDSSARLVSDRPCYAAIFEAVASGGQPSDGIFETERRDQVLRDLMPRMLADVEKEIAAAQVSLDKATAGYEAAKAVRDAGQEVLSKISDDARASSELRRLARNAALTKSNPALA